jgi:DNA-binding MarR family transcriptional regulator
MPAYPTLSTQVIGQAESALGAILGPILTQTQTSFEEWLVLTVTTASGGEIDQDQLAGRISGARKIDPEVVRAAIRSLADAGLVAGSPQLHLTEAGKERFQQIRGRIDTVNAQLFGDLPAEDLETAGRVLSIVTARASAVLSQA